MAPPPLLPSSFGRSLGQCFAFVLSLVLIWGPPCRGQDRVTRFIQPGQPQEVIIGPKEELRWVCATSSRAIVRFFAEPADPASNATFQLRGAQGSAGNPVWARSGGTEPGAEAVLSAETDDAVPVRVWAETEPEFDPSEPNDRFEEAAALAPEGNRFFLYPKADQDWFSFRVTVAAEYRMIVVVPRGGSVFHEGLELGICDAAAHPLVQRLGQVDSQGTWRTIPFELKPGEYRCWIRARSERYSRFPLTLRFEQLGVQPSQPTIPAPAPKHSPAVPAPPSPAVAPAPLRPPPAGSPAAEPPVPAQKNSMGPMILLAALVGMLFWWGAALMRPRRVFDLTR